MLTIRLARVGKTKQPQYRVVVADHRRAVTGRFVDVVGHVNPLTDPATITLKSDKVTEWLSKGARPSETVQTILIRENIIKAPAKQIKRVTKAAKNPDKYGKATTATPAAQALAESSDPSDGAETVDSTVEEASADVDPQVTESGAEATDAPKTDDEQSKSPSADPGTDGAAGDA